ncbi:MAG: type II secretion system F family protein [Candidatus Nanopelagicales bacterium]
MTALLVACLTGACLLMWSWRVPPTRRLEQLVRAQQDVTSSNSLNPRPAAPTNDAVDPRLIFAACVAGAFGCWMLVGGLMGIVLAGAILVVGPRMLAAVEPRSVRTRRQALESAAPMVADLMAACLSSGASAGAATRTVSQALDGPASDVLAKCVTHIDLGADPTQTWSSMTAGTALGPIARAVVRSAQSGAPLADVLVRVADDLRSARKSTLETAARSAGIKAVGPLGLCFLPAFMLLGIVPLVASLIVQMTG